MMVPIARSQKNVFLHCKRTSPFVMKKFAVITLCLLLLQSVSAQQAFNVYVDTLFVAGNHVEWCDYSFSGYNDKWHWTRSKPYPSVLFEDDLYTVSHDNFYGGVLFTAKEPSLYIDTHNGGLQHEYVNWQYYFTGEFHQILRHGDYYYFINPKRVDSFRIDQSPGNPLVKNIIPDIWDNNLLLCQNNSKWCDPQSGYGDGWYFRGYICHGCCIGSHRSYTMPTDTLFHGAFVSDDQLFYVVSYGNEMFIAQRNGNDLTRVKELGQGWNFYDYYGGPNRWWNLGTGDNRLILPFSTTEGSAGLLTIAGHDIHIRYIAQQKTVVP